ncbi:MAG: hypothetical protein Q9191_002037 [Dirinaria sp. TL-2023a]
MATSTAPRNRRERRAQAAASQEEKQVPLAQPSRDAPKQKTLLQIAAERQLLADSYSETADFNPSSASVVTTRINADGTLSHVPAPSLESSKEDSASPWLDIVLYTTSLVLLHFTLTFLVTHQYSPSPPHLLPVFLSSTVFNRTPPLLLLMVSALHPRASHPMLQIGFAVMAMACGGYLVKISNEDPYMAVMKQAPELGTLWVWSVVECRWELALLGVLGVGGWGWWEGYTFW